MNVIFKILIFGFVIGSSAHADTKLNEFYGIRIGMSKEEVLAEMKKKGFEYTSKEHGARSALDGCVSNTVDTKGMGISDSSYVLCYRKNPTPSDTIHFVNCILYKNQVILIEAFFNPYSIEDGIKGIVGKFGFPESGAPAFSALSELNTTVRQICSDSQCREKTWRKKDRWARLVYVAHHDGSGKPVRLQIKDLAAEKKLNAQFGSTLLNESKEKAKSLGF